MTRWALLAGAMACWCLATCSTAPAAPATSPATQPAGELTLDLGNKVTMKLALIPAGKFLMGSPADEQERFDDETQHEVTISRPFYMGVTEVTQEQYEAVMGNNPSRFKGDKNPVETVSWNDAMEFCKKLSARTNKTVRLPTEAQWEYACRAGTATPFHTGATISTDEANYDGNSTYGDGPKGEDRLKTIAVASFKPNAFGLYDTHGNVWEWCPDWHADYAKGAVKDPTGPATGRDRVLRGGSWVDAPRYCRSAKRIRMAPGTRNRYFGFRVALDVP